MQYNYLKSFSLASEDDEVSYILSFPAKLEMTCYGTSAYPFKIFPQKGLHTLEFEPVTLIYGSNGSGKSTLLNIIAQKLGVLRCAPFNYTPLYEDYLRYCRYTLAYGRSVPPESRVITSDDVFDFLLDLRAINSGIEGRRQTVFEEYDEYTDPNKPAFVLRSIEDYDELKRRNEARKGTKASYTRRRIPKDICEKSNGESAFAYFTSQIKENALYLLDEPENSLSVPLQLELMRFISDSARFYGCQFIISTHSPFLLSLGGSGVYDLDCSPVCRKSWTQLGNVTAYRDFFESHKKEFENKDK